MNSEPHFCAKIKKFVKEHAEAEDFEKKMIKLGFISETQQKPKSLLTIRKKSLQVRYT